MVDCFVNLELGHYSNMAEVSNISLQKDDLYKKSLKVKLAQNMSTDP